MKATRENPILYIVIPCYNEQEVLPITSKLFLKKITDLVAAGKISDDSRVLFVNDGSKDKTWSIICDLDKALNRHQQEPQPRSPERSAGRFDGSQGQVRYHHLH